MNGGHLRPSSLLANLRRAIVIDVDGTICPVKDSAASYSDVGPNETVVSKLREYKELGFTITLHTSRTMNTFDGNIGRINAVTLPELIAWLDKHEIPYDEIVTGKPWPGPDGFYVDDRTLRPDEFVALSPEEAQRFVNAL